MFHLVSLERCLASIRRHAAGRRVIALLDDAALKRVSFGKGVSENPHSPHFLFTGERGITVKVSSVRENRTLVCATEWRHCQSRKGVRRESLSLRAEFGPPKLLGRRKLVKRKLISHYFPRRGAENNDRFARGRNSKKRKLARKLKNRYLCISYKRKLVNRLLVYRGISVYWILSIRRQYLVQGRIWSFTIVLGLCRLVGKNLRFRKGGTWLPRFEDRLPRH
jgi:hypothetical protein